MKKQRRFKYTLKRIIDNTYYDLNEWMHLQIIILIVGIFLIILASIICN